VRSLNNPPDKVFIETVYRDVIGKGRNVREALKDISSIQVICPEVVYCRYRCSETEVNLIKNFSKNCRPIHIEDNYTNEKW